MERERTLEQQVDDGSLLYQYKQWVENLKDEREGLGWTTARC